MSTPYLNLGIVSAYADAKRGGYTGTYDEFCALLAGIGGLQPKLTAGQNISITGTTIDTKAFPCNPNLLDNWYFGNPVNQRGQASWGVADTYTIDRWKIEGYLQGDKGVTLNNTFITIFNNETTNNGYIGILESLENDLAENTEITISVLTATGLCVFSTTVPEAAATVRAKDFQNFTVYFYRVSERQSVVLRCSSGQSESVYAIKLELGSQQTLAHQDANGAWVLNEIPDYAEQLLKCQRYLRPAGTQFITSQASGNIYGSVVMNNSYPMRAVPSIVNANYVGSEVREVTGGVAGTITNVFTPDIYGSFTVQLSGTSMPNYVYIDPTGFNPLLSAEL